MKNKNVLKKSSRATLFSETTKSRISTNTLQNKKPTNNPKVILRSKLKEPLLFVTGKEIDDIFANEIINSLERIGFINFLAIGGKAIKKTKVELLALIEKIEKTNILSIFDPIVLYYKRKKILKLLEQHEFGNKIKTAIFIGNASNNLPLATILKKKGIRIIYITGSDIYSWHYRQIRILKKATDLVLSSFQFEEELYKKEKIAGHFIGYPYFNKIQSRLINENMLSKSYNISKQKRSLVIALLPGSHPSEIKRLLKDMIAAGKILKEKYPRVSFLLGGANLNINLWMEKLIRKYNKKASIDIRYRSQLTLNVMDEANLFILSSSRVSLEAIYFRKPMVVIYRPSWLRTLLYTVLLRTPYIAIVNLLLNKQIVPELLQAEVSPKNIASAVQYLLEDEAYKKELIRNIDKAKAKLMRHNSVKEARNSIIDFIHKKH